MRRALLGLCLAMGVLGGCKETATKPQIAVIPKGTTHEFWKSVHAGAEQAGKDLNVDIIWKGPLKEDDRAAQIQVVQQFVADRVSGIVLAPLDAEALVGPVQQAEAQKVPVVIIDSGLKAEAGKDFVSFVATDNYKGGQIGGEQLAKLLNNKGKVTLLRYAEGSASTEEREKGFLDAIGKHSDIQLVGDIRYGGATVDSAKTKALNAIDSIKQSDGIFCPNESTTQGMLLALDEAGLTGKVKFVGFDQTPRLIDALKKNELDGLVAQDPFKMGYEGVKALVSHLNGQQVEQRVDTGVHLITRENLSDPDIQKLLQH